MNKKELVHRHVSEHIMDGLNNIKHESLTEVLEDLAVKVWNAAIDHACENMEDGESAYNQSHIVQKASKVTT